MTKYVAMLRGIMPTNPNMKGAKLKGVFEELGFKNVQTLITSGNVLFESDYKNIETLEKTIEEAWPKKLCFSSTTIIKSQQELQELVNNNPFKGAEHSQKTYLLVTFFKTPPKINFEFPYTPEGKTYTLLGMYENAICSSIDLSGNRTPDLMAYLEKQFGKQITSRTWGTINRILQKME